MNKGTLKQILLLTDGCSNSGTSPVKAAERAFGTGITVNVIGILKITSLRQMMLFLKWKGSLRLAAVFIRLYIRKIYPRQFRRSLLKRCPRRFKDS